MSPGPSANAEVEANAYLGTSEFAAEVLAALARSRHRPRLVITPPDRRRGRGRRLLSPPVAELARELEIEVHQTADVNDAESVAAIEASGVGLACVCAFGQLIREPLLSSMDFLNVHPSLLPRWRGAAPIERAIMAGDERTGVCVMSLTAGLDSGPVALTEECPIAAEQTYGELAGELSRLGGELLVRALDLRAGGELSPQPQAEVGVTYAERIEASERRLDPGQPAPSVARTVWALTPHIGAYLVLEGGERLGVRAARAADGRLAPWAVAIEGDRLLVGCSPGELVVSELRPPGAGTMSVADWLRGGAPRELALAR